MRRWGCRYENSSQTRQRDRSWGRTRCAAARGEQDSREATTHYMCSPLLRHLFIPPALRAGDRRDGPFPLAFCALTLSLIPVVSLPGCARVWRGCLLYIICRWARVYIGREGRTLEGLDASRRDGRAQLLQHHGGDLRGQGGALCVCGFASVVADGRRSSLCFLFGEVWWSVFARLFVEM